MLEKRMSLRKGGEVQFRSFLKLPLRTVALLHVVEYPLQGSYFSKIDLYGR